MSPKLKDAMLQPAVPAGSMFSRFHCSHDLGELPQLAPHTRKFFFFIFGKAAKRKSTRSFVLASVL